jgi:hypothetical protein
MIATMMKKYLFVITVLITVGTTAQQAPGKKSIRQAM